MQKKEAIHLIEEALKTNDIEDLTNMAKCIQKLFTEKKTEEIVSVIRAKIRFLRILQSGQRPAHFSDTRSEWLTLEKTREEALANIEKWE